MAAYDRDGNKFIQNILKDPNYTDEEKYNYFLTHPRKVRNATTKKENKKSFAATELAKLIPGFVPGASNPTGTGFRTKYRKSVSAGRLRTILEGEIAAGNNNPLLRAKLMAMKRNRGLNRRRHNF